MKKPHIMFDFDGVLADTFELTYRLVQTLQKNITKEQYIRHHIGNVYVEPIIPFSEEEMLHFVALYQQRISVLHLQHAVPSLRALSDLYTLHVVSSNCEQAISQVLEKAGVAECIEMVLGRAASRSKVDKFQYLAAQRRFDLSKSVYITDTVGDLREAKQVGLPTIAVTFGYHSYELLHEYQPTRIAHDWQSVSAHIRELIV